MWKTNQIEKISSYLNISNTYFVCSSFSTMRCLFQYECVTSLVAYSFWHNIHRIIRYEFRWIEINCGFLTHKNVPLWCHLPMVLASWARLLLLNKFISSLYLSIFKRHFKLSLILLANLISLERHNYKMCVPLWKE